MQHFFAMSPMPTSSSAPFEMLKDFANSAPSPLLQGSTPKAVPHDVRLQETRPASPTAIQPVFDVGGHRRTDSRTTRGRFQSLALWDFAHATAITGMTAPRCRPRWTQKSACCALCLAEASLSGQAITWQRHSMHPLAAVCTLRRSRLVPVTARQLHDVRHARGMTELADHAMQRDDARDDSVTILDRSAPYDGSSGRLLRVFE